MFERPRRTRPRIGVVAAARPNFMKVGPVIRALESRADVELVHTGQHYDTTTSACRTGSSPICACPNRM